MLNLFIEFITFQVYSSIGDALVSDWLEATYKTTIMSPELFRRLEELGVIKHVAFGFLVEDRLIDLLGGEGLSVDFIDKLNEISQKIEALSEKISSVEERIEQLENRVTSIESTYVAKPPEAAGVQLKERDKKILEAFKEGEELRFKDIAERTGISPKHLGNYLSELVKRGLLVKVRKGTYKLSQEYAEG